MQRRDILNIFLNRSTFEQPVTIEPDPVLFTPAHLLTDHSTVLLKEWDLSEINRQITLEVSNQFAFTLMLEYKNTGDSIASAESSALFIGTKKSASATEHKQTDVNDTGIHLGIKDGCLFMGELKDLRVIDQAKLAEGLQLTLTVNPLTDGKTYAKLKVTDQSGLMLSAIRSKQFAPDDWIGEIFTGIHFTSLCMQGRQLIKHELI